MAEDQQGQGIPGGVYRDQRSGEASLEAFRGERAPASRSGLLLGAFSIAVIALVAHWLGGYVPQLGAGIIAMVVGLILRSAFRLGGQFPAVTSFLTKRVLKFAIVLLGATYTLGQAVQVAGGYLPVILVTIGVAIAAALFAGFVLRVPPRLTMLIGAGTAICGATAILAISPLIRARREETSYAIATIFLFNLTAMLLFPPIGGWLGLEQTTFGAWAGAAIHDTSSVLAAGFAYGDVAGETAVVVKLGRTLMLIPLLLALTLVSATSKRPNKYESGLNKAKAALKAFPWFIVAFLAVAALASLGLITVQAGDLMGGVGKGLLIPVLAAVGLGTELGHVRRLGLAAMAVACGASLIAAGVSLAIL